RPVVESGGRVVAASPAMLGVGVQQAFYVQVDFATPYSFTFSVVVFRSAADAAQYARKSAAACRKAASCIRDGYQQQGRVIGRVDYSGDVKRGTSAVGDFEKIAALASGRSSKH